MSRFGSSSLLKTELWRLLSLPFPNFNKIRRNYDIQTLREISRQSGIKVVLIERENLMSVSLRRGRDGARARVAARGAG